MNEDDIEVDFIKDGEKILKPYRASRYIKEYYETQEKLTEELFNRYIITYKTIADTTGLTPTVVRNTILKKVKNPQPNVRRAIDIFFNKDYYPELGKYNGVNDKCKKKCKFPYWVDVLRCGAHSKK